MCYLTQRHFNMKNLYIANANFEFELRETKTIYLQEALEQHPLLLQLQFLPVLYANSIDGIAVTNIPDDSYIQQLTSKFELPNFVRLDSSKSPQCEHLISWGCSRQVEQWALQHGIEYSIPPWEIVRKVNSKAFSFENSPKLPLAQSVYDMNSLKEWLANIEGQAVLKCCFGVSGRGNLKIKSNKEVSWNIVEAFCQKEWDNNLPVIAEPWMDNVCDFSTQWKITSEGEIQFLGAARFQNNNQGTYQSTFSGPEEILFPKELKIFLKEHLQKAKSILEKVRQEGYVGHAGIDSMIYREKGKLILHPIVEINARQTMSLAAIWFQQKWFPNDTISLSYVKKQDERQGLLPKNLQKKDGSLITFTRQLYYSKEKPTNLI